MQNVQHLKHFCEIKQSSSCTLPTSPRVNHRHFSKQGLTIIPQNQSNGWVCVIHDVGVWGQWWENWIWSCLDPAHLLQYNNLSACYLAVKLSSRSAKRKNWSSWWMEEFNHMVKNGNRWMGGWQYLFPCAIHMVYICKSCFLKLKII